MNPTPSNGEPAMVRRWLVPGVCSRRGAAHRRRGQPCQDATLQQDFTLPGGLPLTLLAVADGHGGLAYHHSDVGSALACQAAAEVVAADLARLPSGGTTPAGADLMVLRRWLAGDLPNALQQRWLAAVRQHWLAGPGRGEAGAAFSPVPYGSTLGLLLLTPRWWALAGLGDWDLVRIDQAGAAELLSQEVAAAGAGEATASLCQEGADLGGWFRSWVWPLDDQQLPFALVLCTDGIRKSCATDADFLALTAWLAAGPEANIAASDPTVSDPGVRGAGDEVFLVEALDRITAEGCGDDVSVAIGRWQPGEKAPFPFDRQAPIAPIAPNAQEPRRPLRGLLLLFTGGLALLFALALGRRLPLSAGPAGPPLGPRPGLPTASDTLRREVARLCRDPALLGPSLRTRHSQVLGLRQGTLRPEPLLADAARDPLGALIAASFLERHPQAGRPSGGPSLGGCPVLQSALGGLWLPLRTEAIPAMGSTSARPSR
jgi:hypothetical protein